MHAPLLRFVVFALAKSPVSLAVAAAPALVHAVVAVAAVLAALAPLALVAPPRTPYQLTNERSKLKIIQLLYQLKEVTIFEK